MKARTIKLNESDCTFVHYILRMYAKTNPHLDNEDKYEIYKVADNFK